MSGVKDSTKKDALQARAQLPRTIRQGSAPQLSSPSFIPGQALETTQVRFRAKGTAVRVGPIQPDLEFSLFLPASFKDDKTKQHPTNYIK